MRATRNDTAGVIAPPPLLYGSALAAGLALHRVVPLLLRSHKTGASRVVGGVLAGIGLSASIAVTMAFRKAATPVSPMRPTARLVLTGPYRYSRNPDYLGQLLLYLGVTVEANTWGPIVLLPPVLAMIGRGVVLREEEYLEAKFGREYREYKRSMRAPPVTAGPSGRRARRPHIPGPRSTRR